MVATKEVSGCQSIAKVCGYAPFVAQKYGAALSIALLKQQQCLLPSGVKYGLIFAVRFFK